MQDARWVITKTGRHDRPSIGWVGCWLLAALAVGAILAARAQAGDAGDRATENRAIEKRCTETTVRVYPTAVVTTDHVTLANIAEVRGEGSELAAGCTIVSGLRPGHKRDVSLEHVQKVLSGRGVNLGWWVFRGSTRCAVTRLRPICDEIQTASGSARKPCHRRTDDMLVRDPVTDLVDSGRRGDRCHAWATGRSPDDTSVANIDPSTLSGSIHQHIARRLGKIGGIPSLRFSPTLSDTLKLSRPAYDFAIISRSDRVLGYVPLEITFYEKGQFKQVISTLVDVSVRVPVVVAAHPINCKQTIRSRDLAIENRIVDRMDELGLTDPAPLIGQRAKNFINKGNKVTARDIEPVPLVSKNDLVTVWFRRGNLKIKGTAKAMSTGGYGEPVELRNFASKKTFTAVVTGEKTAEISGADHGPTIAAAWQKQKRNP